MICRRQRPGVHAQMPVSTPSLRSTEVTEAIATGSPSGTATGLEVSSATLSVFLKWVMFMPGFPVK
ncbi:hypothetical protein D3C81_2311200 [compost metagenome]